jgi:KipI family sensor histidine kinase inhibitor
MIRVIPFGPSGLFVEFAARMDPAALALGRGLLRALEEKPVEGLRDATLAYGTLLLEFAEGSPPPVAEVTEVLRSASPVPAGETRTHEIPVVYDGPDLEALARRNKLPVSEIIARHSAPVYDVCLIGFSPGFPYLGPLDEKLHAPRLEHPRPRVPAGSVGIGGEHTGIYSIASPGGWWLVGRTKVELFSEKAARGHGSEAAFLLRPGDRVQFVPA